MKLTKTLKNKDNQMKTIRIICSKMYIEIDMSHSQMVGKFEYGGGPIFKVVLEC